MATTTQGARPAKVKRFGRWSIICHWFYAVCFLALLITGFGMMYDWLAFLAGPTARFIHRVAAIGFVVGPVLYLVGSAGEAWGHIKEVLSWSREDFGWLAVALPYHFRGRPKPPPQGFLNAGQKLNYLVVTVTFFVFVATGLVMWFVRPDLEVAQRGVFWWSVLLHSSAAWVAAAMFLVHVYTAGVHPFTRPSLRGMVDGHVSLDYALFEHPKWAKQFVSKGGSE